MFLVKVITFVKYYTYIQQIPISARVNREITGGLIYQRQIGCLLAREFSQELKSLKSEGEALLTSTMQ